MRFLDILVCVGEFIYCFDLFKVLVWCVLEEYGELFEVFKDIIVRMEVSFNKFFIIYKRIFLFSGLIKIKLSLDLNEIVI